MKIAIISTMAAFPWGGSEELWAQMAVEAIKDDHEVMALLPKWTPRHDKVQYLEGMGVQVEEWSEKSTHPEVNVSNGLSPWYPYQSIIDFKPDIVCVSHGGFLDIVNGHSLLFVMLLQLKIPFVTIIQANTDLYNIEQSHRSLMQEYLSRSQGVLFVSRENLRIAERHLARKLPNAAVINNPVNLKDHSAVPWPTSSAPKFACVARFDTFAKGHDILFEVLGQPKWRERNWTMSLYGAGDHEDYIRQLIAHFELAQHVFIKGTTSSIRGIWAEHHLLILSSRLEGTPLVLMESMLCGRPAVVTNVGGNSDWIVNNETGFLAWAANVELLDLALEGAWSNQDKWNEIGDNARKYFLANHEVNSGQTLLNLLRDLDGPNEAGIST